MLSSSLGICFVRNMIVVVVQRALLPFAFVEDLRSFLFLARNQKWIRRLRLRLYLTSSRFSLLLSSRHYLLY